jgi:hypothetical protein
LRFWLWYVSFVSRLCVRLLVGGRCGCGGSTLACLSRVSRCGLCGRWVPAWLLRLAPGGCLGVSSGCSCARRWLVGSGFTRLLARSWFRFRSRAVARWLRLPGLFLRTIYVQFKGLNSPGEAVKPSQKRGSGEPNPGGSGGRMLTKSLATQPAAYAARVWAAVADFLGAHRKPGPELPSPRLDDAHRSRQAKKRSSIKKANSSNSV